MRSVAIFSPCCSSPDRRSLPTRRGPPRHGRLRRRKSRAVLRRARRPDRYCGGTDARQLADQQCPIAELVRRGDLPIMPVLASGEPAATYASLCRAPASGRPARSRGFLLSLVSHEIIWRFFASFRSRFLSGSQTRPPPQIRTAGLGWLGARDSRSAHHRPLPDTEALRIGDRARPPARTFLASIGNPRLCWAATDGFPRILEMVMSRLQTVVKQAYGKEGGGSENPVAAILTHRRRMAQKAASGGTGSAGPPNGFAHDPTRGAK